MPNLSGENGRVGSQSDTCTARRTTIISDDMRKVTGRNETSVTQVTQTRTTSKSQIYNLPPPLPVPAVTRRPLGPTWSPSGVSCTKYSDALALPEPSSKQLDVTSRPSVPRCLILSTANSLVTAAVASPVMPIASSSPSLTLPNLTRTHHRMSWHVPTRPRRHPSLSIPQTSRQQNRARFCKIRQRESGIPARPWRRSLPCLLRCSAPVGRSCHPSFLPQSSRKTSAI